MCLRENSIDIGFREVYDKLIETRNEKDTSGPSDPRDCKNPVITLDRMSHDPSD